MGSVNVAMIVSVKENLTILRIAVREKSDFFEKFINSEKMFAAALHARSRARNSTTCDWFVQIYFQSKFGALWTKVRQLRLLTIFVQQMPESHPPCLKFR